MFLILGIDIIVVLTLTYVIATQSFERALPYFVFIITLLPEECRIPLPGLFELYTHRLALIVLAVAFFLGKKKSAVRTLPLKNLMLLNIGWAFISVFTSIAMTTSIKQLIAQVVEYYLIYYICLKTISTTRTISDSMLAMITAVGIACIFGLFEIYGGWTVLSLFPAEMQLTYGTGSALYVELTDRGIRARSVFPHPILFGGAISMVVPMTLYALSTAKTFGKKIFLNACLLLLFWNLFKTSSRGPWIATCLAMAVLLFATKAKVRKRILMLGVLAVVVLIVRPGVADTLWNMYLATLDPGSQMGSSYAYRPVLFHTVNQVLLDSPLRALVGFGLGAFREKGLILVLPGIETHRWYTCDSAWILFMYETGYVGFGIIAALLFKPAFAAARGYMQLPVRDRDFCLICVSSFVSFFFVMMSVAVYAWGQNGHMLWILIGMTMSYIHLMKKRQQPSKGRLKEESSACTIEISGHPATP